MAILTSTSLIDALRQLRLLEPGQLEEIAAFQARFQDSKALAKELIQRGWLTAYQANQLLQGRGQELVLGSHILLEKLGEGGMGQVFKARNQKLGRVVALKLIRKEKLDSHNAIRRFRREVQAAAQLNHPNVVLAYDADEVGGTHLLIMEYVAGATDLAKLVKKNGPLPVQQACDCIRQAALGLQHAYERGLVHRDIKPANLLLTADGKAIKILDMGLARLEQAAADDDDSSTMTQEGAVMGTPDYIAPEQAMSPHTADVRADIYSLGCTLYYLLTGRVPFPKGSLTEKLLQHQLDEPFPVEEQRNDVPPAVTAVLRKMMAKKPQDRYQTPADAAAALASIFDLSGHYVGGAGAADSSTSHGSHAITAGEPGEDTLHSALEYMARVGDGPISKGTSRSIKLPAKRRWPLYSAAGGVFVAALFAVSVLSWPHKPPEKDKKLIVPDPVPAKQGPTWTVLDAETLKSVGGVILTKQADGSILASGQNPLQDAYVITAKTNLKDITGIRLEVLADPSLPTKGPGRAFNGNFVLSEFTLAVARADETAEKAEPVQLHKPLATFSQLGYGIAAAIDNNPQTGWAMLPRVGQDHAAAFELKDKVGGAGGSLLVFTLDQKFSGNHHNIGKFRLSVTTKQPPILPYPDVPTPDGETYLSDLPELDVKAPHNHFGKNGGTEVHGQHHAIWVNDKPSPKGIFLHPPANGFSCAGYELWGRYRWFQATAAINDSGNSASPLTFVVWGDGKTLWKSRPLQQRGETDDCSIDIKGIRRLDLEVDCSGSNQYAHAVWVQPRLLKTVPQK